METIPSTARCCISVDGAAEPGARAWFPLAPSLLPDSFQLSSLLLLPFFRLVSCDNSFCHVQFGGAMGMPSCSPLFFPPFHVPSIVASFQERGLNELSCRGSSRRQLRQMRCDVAPPQTTDRVTSHSDFASLSSPFSAETWRHNPRRSSYGRRGKGPSPASGLESRE